MITVSRTKVYPSKAHPGPAWTYVYDVTIPGEPHTFSGERLSWVRSLCKSKRPGMPIEFAWESDATRAAARKG